MRIVFNTDQVFLHGGVEKVITTKANYFANLPDVEVFFVTTEQNGKPPVYPLDAKVKLIDLEVNYNRKKSYFSRENLVKAIKHFEEQKKIFNDINPDFVISPNYNFDHYWLPFIHKKSKKIKERHGSRFFENEQRKSASFFIKLKFLFEDWIDRKYYKIVVLNKDEQSYLRSKNGVVIPNPIDINDQKSNVENPLVIAAGRIAPVKRFGDLVKSWQIVNREFPDWQLHIYGDDYLDTKADLTNMVKIMSLEKSVIFKQSVENLPKTMTNYSIYAMSSETECFPMVLLEALSVGVPLISYNCPNGPRNIITENSDGFLVENQNIQALADKLILLIKNESLRKKMSENALENVKRFGTKSVMKQWDDLIKNID